MSDDQAAIIEALRAERDAALAREAALGEVIAAINAHPDRLEPVFETILEKAHLLCGAGIGALALYEDGMLRNIASRGFVDQRAAANRRPRRPNDYERDMLEGKSPVAHIPDLLAIDPATDGGLARRTAEVTGGRTGIAIPFRKDSATLGYVTVFRAEMRPFQDSEITLLTAFAAQAVVAIENARALGALRQRDEDNRNLIARQAASVEILRAISTTPDDPQPVFDLIARHARTLCDADQAAVTEFDGTLIHMRATDGYVATDYFPRPPDAENLHGRLILGEGLIHIRDRDVAPSGTNAAISERLGSRSLLAAPLVSDGRVIGGIVVRRRAPGGFDDAQIAMLETFADQAVIAISSAAALRDLRERTGELAARNTAYAEQIDHQAATIDVLKAMSASPGDPQPVFDLITRSAQVLCGSIFGGLIEYDGELAHMRSDFGTIPGDREAFLRRFPMRPHRGSAPLRAILDAEVVHIRDISADAGLADFARGLGAGATAAVPMLRDGRAVGAITINAAEPGGFSDAQIDLLKTFAEQAVIAITSAEAFRALEARTADLNTQVSHQEASIDVLRAIAESGAEIQPVFDVILRRALALCGSSAGGLFTYDGTLVDIGRIITPGIPPDVVAAHFRQFPRPPQRDLIVERAILDGLTVYERDIQAAEGVQASGRALGHRSTLAVPLMSDGAPIGALSLIHPEVAGFTPAQVALVETFAAQAVIAMRSAGTLKALAERNAAFAEQVAHQAATIDVLKAISASPGNAQPVFELIVRRVQELCGSTDASLMEYDGALLHHRGTAGAARSRNPAALEAMLREYPRPPTPGGISDRVVRTGGIFAVDDLTDDPTMPVAERPLGLRAVLAVPLLRDGRVRGVINLTRDRPGPFSAAQQALLQTFAEQAVIAIGAAETFRALQERTAELAARNSDFAERIDQQAATIDVLKVMSASPDDTQPVFDQIVRRAQELCGSTVAALFEYDGELVHYRAYSNGTLQSVAEHAASGPVGAAYAVLWPMPPSRKSIVCWAILDRQVIHIRDRDAVAGLEPATRTQNNRSLLVIPLLRDDMVLGSILLASAEVGGFTDSQVELLKTFAEQAVIAIGSVATYRALRERTAELAARNSDFAERIDQQAATIDVLKVMSASPDDTQPVFDQIVRRARDLCEGHSSGLWEYDGKLVHLRAGSIYQLGDTVADIAASGPEGAAFVARFPSPPTPGGNLSRAIASREMNIVDWTTGEREPSPLHVAQGVRASLTIPLLRDGEAIGAITLTTRNPDGFTESQIALMQTFAEQAVIAIGAVATYRALRERTAELDEKVAHQAATIEVLKVMSASPGDPQPVFDLIAQQVRALSSVATAGVFEFDGTLINLRSVANIQEVPDAAWARFLASYPRNPSPTAIGEEAMREGRAIYRAIDPDDPLASDERRALGYRHLLAVPMLLDGEPVGHINVASWKTAPLRDSQVALVEAFAEQASIAIGSARAFRALKERTAELANQIKQQAAMIDVLKAIAASDTDIDPVLDTILRRALDLCGGMAGSVFTFDGETMDLRRSFIGSLPAAAVTNHTSQWPRPPGRVLVVDRAIVEGRTINSPDIRAEPGIPAAALAMGHRSTLAVPMIRDGKPIGILSIVHKEVAAFNDAQVALVETFAEQAVIAMRSAETLRALATRNSEFAVQVAHQAATIDVLKAMSASTNDTRPVFELILRRAVQLCRVVHGALFEFDGEYLQAPVSILTGREMEEYRRGRFPRRLRPDVLVDTAIRDRKTAYFPDITALPPGLKAMPNAPYKAYLAVPLLRDGVSIGAIGVGHPDVDGFSEADIELLKAFAEQAAIAISSVSTFRALQERTAELTRSVAELQALEAVLRAVNSSLDLDTVLATIIERAVPLAGADEGLIYEFSEAEQVFVPKAAFGMSDERVAALRERRIRIGETYLGRSAAERAPVAVADVQTDGGTPEARTLLQGIHAVLAVPLLRDNAVVGGLVIRRRHEGEFTPATIALMQTFAAQSVLAIQNARLFNEVEARTREVSEALKYQSATADVLKAISRSAFDLDAVLETLTHSAATLCEADTGNLRVRDREGFRLGASFGFAPDGIAYLRTVPLVPGRGSISARVAQSLDVVMLEDEQEDPEIDRDLLRVTPNRAVLGVPLLRDGVLEGVFVLGRTRPVAFSARQIALVQTFADQAVIAIQNARLFEQVQARTRELTQSLADLRAAQDRLIQTEKLASLGQLTAGIAHEIKNPLNFVNNFAALSVELLGELGEALGPAPLAEQTREEVEELTGMLKGNLEKVVAHGKRADGIVRNMLLHSRESGGERRSVDLNATVEEALNLAYHGARAEKPGFNVTLVRSYDPAAGAVELYPQEFTRVLLNLIGNGFYAASRRKAEAGEDYEPTLSVSTEAAGERVIIRVRDNGTGMPESVKARIFEPFFTTKPAGEGTGLGLSLSHDIITKQHGGSVTVDSAENGFTEFTVTLPRAGGTAGGG